MSLFIRSWRRARDLARQRQGVGRLDESLHYLVHAIRSAPRRAELVEEYAEVATAHADQARSSGSIDEAARRLDLLEAFVREAAMQVKVDDVAALLTLAADVAARRAKLAASGDDAEDEPTPPPLEPSAAQPADDYVPAVNGPEIADPIDAATQSVRKLINDANAQPSGVAVTLLGAADVTLRSVIALAVQERPAALPELEALLGELRDRADALAAGLRAREADEAWSSFRKRRALQLEEARSWPPPAEYRECEDRLGRIREVLLEVAHLGPTLAGTPRETDIQQLATELRGAGERLGKEQSDRYNRWAMTQIEKGFEHAANEAGFFGDLEEVGRRLIDHYGPIDVRYLQHEAARCHSETFEHLFAKLASPPDSATAATKIFVLRALFGAKKRDLSEF